MTISVLNSAAFAAGGTFTPNSGTSNRMMLAVAYGLANPPPTLTNIIYNGVTRTPAVSNTWSTSVLSMGVSLFLNSELSGSAQTVTPTWSVTPGQNYMVCVAIDGAVQSTTPDATAGPYQQTDTNASSLAISPITVNDFVMGFSVNRGGLTVTDSTAGWTSLQSALIPSGSGVYDVSYHIASATSDTYALSYSGTADFILSDIAIAAAAAATGINRLPTPTYVRFFV